MIKCYGTFRCRSPPGTQNILSPAPNKKKTVDPIVDVSPRAYQSLKIKKNERKIRKSKKGRRKARKFLENKKNKFKLRKMIKKEREINA